MQVGDLVKMRDSALWVRHNHTGEVIHSHPGIEGIVDAILPFPEDTLYLIRVLDRHRLVNAEDIAGVVRRIK